MTRVLLVSRRAKPGGAERALVALTRQLPALGFEPSVALLEGGPLEDWLRAAGCEPTLVVEGRRSSDGAIAGLRRLLRRTRADVVVSNKWDTHLRGGLAALAEGVPAVCWQQDIAGRSPLDRALAAIPTAAIICLSDYAVRAQRRLTPGRRIVKVHLGVATREIAKLRGTGQPLRPSLGWEDHPVVGIVGRLERWKGQETFLRAARRIARKHPTVRFAIVGGAILGNEGRYPKRLVELADELGLAERVRFTGHQPDVYPWFDALDVVVHSSHAEPFGLVLVEAMALGKPLVAAAAGGPVEIVVPGESGLLVPPRKPGLLADAVDSILDNPALAARLSAGASERALAFTEERMADGVAEVLREVVRGHS